MVDAAVMVEGEVGFVERVLVVRLYVVVVVVVGVVAASVGVVVVEI